MQKYSKKTPYDRNFERKTYNVFGSKREIACKIKLQRIISESYVFQQVTTSSSSLNQVQLLSFTLKFLAIKAISYIVNPFVQYINSVLFFKGPSFDASDASIVL